MSKRLNVGIASVAQQRARALAIAAGTRKRTSDEPSVWFPSITAAVSVFSDENLALLRAIRESHPDSMGTLAKITGKQASNVSRAVHTLAQYGLVRLTKHGRSVVPESEFEGVNLALGWAPLVGG